MKPDKFTALYTESPPQAGFTPANLLVVFVQRDEQTAQDISATQTQLQTEGYGVHVRGYNFLRDILEIIPDVNLVVLPEPFTVVACDDFNVNPDVQTAIHDCLKALAGQCDGARTLDGHGFNKFDTEFGHSLANTRELSHAQCLAGMNLVRKYQGQLPAPLVRMALHGEFPEVPEEPANVVSIDTTSPTGLTPAELINQHYGDKSGEEVAGNDCEEAYGDTYQNGVKPGAQKLAQFIEVLTLAGTPALYGQEDKGEAAMVHVKLFDPSGSWTWYITEFSKVAPDGVPNLAMGLVCGHEVELGYIDMAELASAKGAMGIGIEIDMHFRQTLLSTVREQV